ncbi:hypothetical protein [Streptomyces sp. 769]|uniref:hypothetical protein n=1 Tax=Streptomyces sp. 769 TaxID=1262452 RepID=UPI000581DE18|nr:hypothetical protein [Streptomyces sp. 769]AJC61949.1 hypothetical protein GZL_p00019 [Streptomyces sp. 769]
MSLYRVTLNFSREAGSPKVTAEWRVEETARATFRRWIGLYGSGMATIRVEEEGDDGSADVLDAWPPTT